MRGSIFKATLTFLLKRVLLDASLGFAGGVMLAASYWSLLAPGIEMAAESGSYGEDGELAFVPAAIGFFLGAAFVYGADLFMDRMGVESPIEIGTVNEFLTFHMVATMSPLLVMTMQSRQNSESMSRNGSPLPPPSPAHGGTASGDTSPDPNHLDVSDGFLRRRRHRTRSSCEDTNSAEEGFTPFDRRESVMQRQREDHWRRILLLIVAITVHNIPEGLAVGVGFGAAGRSKSATFESARNLAVGIGIQNFPEGLAVSLPLKAAGFSNWRSIW